jgi:hypothetical protein
MSVLETSKGGDTVTTAFDYPHQFYWQYCYSVQDEDDCWQTLKVSVPPERVWSVRSAIAVDKPVSFILSLIRG